MNNRMLVVSAHVGDFVWRSAGTICKYAEAGWDIKVIVLTFGARGESKSFYKDGTGTYQACCELRKQEAEAAAEQMGIKDVEFCGYEDFCLDMNPSRIRKLADAMAEFKPTLILTHDIGKDRNNPDHTIAAKAVLEAFEIAVHKGMPFAPVYGFEPMSPELCGYRANVYIDITAQWDKKEAAMSCLKTQSGSLPAYEEKATYRASYASGRGGNKECKFAESFSRFFPVYVHDDFAV